MSEIKLNTIPEAIEDLKNGKVIIVVDDENRENEGDFLSAAELTTPEIINFMTIHGRGLICTPLPEKRCDELGLEAMVSRSTDPKETAFTVSIDLLGDGVSTGISASDRAKTILALMDEKTKPTDFMRPGHIFPLRAKTGGVLKRAGHTEAAIDLTKLAGLKEGGVICEIMNEDGTMARLPELVVLAKKLDLKIISIEDLINYQLKKGDLVNEIESRRVKTAFGEFDFHAFQEKHTDQIHFALTKGNWEIDEPVLVRVQSSSAYFDVLSRLIIGEKETKNCGNCYVCTTKNPKTNAISAERQILDILQQKPATLDDLNAILLEFSREKIQEVLIFLLDLGKIRMLDFRTYTIR